jgi:hypothetical protein
MFVVFGGRDAQGQLLGDTWAWDGQTWSPVPTAHTPPPRMDASMAFDEARDRIVLFGGRTLDPSAPLADTWEFDGNDWIERSTPTSPDPRFGHVTTFDPLRQRTVLFGGFTNGGGSNAVDTWEFDGSDWREVLTATTPTTSVFPALGFHRGHGVAVLVGATGSFNPAPQTWAFDGHDWQRGPLAPSGFAGRQGHAIGYDEARDAMVLFGGATITLGGAMPRQETWELSERAVFEPFGRGCATSAGPLGLESPNGGRPEIGRALDLEAGPLPPAALPLLLHGLDDASWAGLSLPLELSGFGLPGCDLLVRIDAVEPMVVGGAVATAQLRIPREVGLVGRELFAQALLACADGATSNAARLILGN